ncbi:MAG: hypothetical protein M3063_02185 [Actinomycetota bacterium]|nr:hypothetical protein [Actinomycetota bacterium]
MAYTAQRVNFPFDQALALARQYQALADQIDRTQASRQGSKHLASDQWHGRFADEFDQRMTSAATGAGNVVTALRRGASDLAKAWADAQHQQQIYVYYAMVQHKKDNQSLLDQGLSFFGLDSIDTGSKPGPPPVPAGPGFAATVIPQAHVPGESAPPLGATTSP